MKYRLVARGKSGESEGPKKYYATPVSSGQMSQASLSKEIAGRSSLTKGDVSNVVMNLIDELPNGLLDGKSVKLDGFGSFRISFSSVGVDEEGDFNTSMIKGAKIIFTPSPELKSILGSLHFEHE